MSTRKRIGRAAIAALTVLAIGSIGSAGVLGATSFGPDKVFAASPQAQEGALGVGVRTIAPLTDPDPLSDKVGVEPQAAAAALASMAAPAVKKVSTRAQWLRATRTRIVVRRSYAPRAVRSSSGWSQARCSWYGPGFYGNTMAGGGKLTTTSMVVAHKYLPFGTLIEFSYRGRTVTAVVQDRGPYVAGRVFDLGPGTARALGFAGVDTVRYRIVGRR